MMQYRRLGKSGLKISEFSFGSWVTFGDKVQVKEATQMMSLAFEAGVNFFDNAEIYNQGRSETVMGEALRELSLSRDSYIVSSKVFWGGERPTQIGLSRKHVVEACHAALKRLQVEYLDLYFCHRPDPDTPIEETVWTMNDLIRQGKIFYWGTSEWSAEQISEAHRIAAQRNLIGPTMEQPEYNLFHRERVEQEYLPLYEKYGLGTTIWSPLASGLLTGKYRHGIPSGTRVNLPGYEWLKRSIESVQGQRKIQLAAEIEDLVSKAGLSITQAALLWCLQNPNVSTVILGASRIEQLKDNLNALSVRQRYTPSLHESINRLLG